MSQHTADNSTNFSNNTNSFNNVWNNYTVTDDQSQLLTWLSPLEPKARHRDIQERRVDNVGNGSHKLKNSEAGRTIVGKVKVIRRSCFAMEIRESERHLLGEKDYPWEKKEED